MMTHSAHPAIIVDVKDIAMIMLRFYRRNIRTAHCSVISLELTLVPCPFLLGCSSFPFLCIFRAEAKLLVKTVANLADETDVGLKKEKSSGSNNNNKQIIAKSNLIKSYLI
jgi:hypothetical protein